MNDDDFDQMPPPDVIEEMLKGCRCCRMCSNPPCDGAMAGGMCDEADCHCDDDHDYRDDDLDDRDFENS